MVPLGNTKSGCMIEVKIRKYWGILPNRWTRCVDVEIAKKKRGIYSTMGGAGKIVVHNFDGSEVPNANERKERISNPHMTRKARIKKEGRKEGGKSRPRKNPKTTSIRNPKTPPHSTSGSPHPQSRLSRYRYSRASASSG